MKSEGKQKKMNRKAKRDKKKRQTGRKRHAGTDGPGQRDEKPHHLLLYRLELISGVANIALTLKSSELLSDRKKKNKKNTHSTVDEAGTANVGVGGCWFD